MSVCEGDRECVSVCDGDRECVSVCDGDRECVSVCDGLSRSARLDPLQESGD